MKKIIIFSFMIITLMVLLGCTQPAPTQKEYICSNEEIVTNLSLCPISCELDVLNVLTCKDKFGVHNIKNQGMCDEQYISDKVFACKDNLCIEAIKHLDDCTQFGENYSCIMYPNFSLKCVNFK